MHLISSSKATAATVRQGASKASVRPFTSQSVRVPRAQETDTTTTTTQEETIKKPGFKYDGSMMRWVRDDRWAGKVETTVQPKSGAAYTVWPVVHFALQDAGLRSVTPKEAAEMQQQGWTLIDVRVQDDYDCEHAEGSISFPLYRYVQGNEFWDKVKRAVMTGFAMRATERDPDFQQKAQQQLAGKKVIVVCSIGGTLDTKVRLRNDKYKDGIDDPDRNFGRESRALKACYELLQAGWSSKDMVFMDGGLQQWRFQGYPMASTE